MVWLFDRRGRLGTTRQQRNESFCRECMREEFHSLPALAGEFSVRLSNRAWSVASPGGERRGRRKRSTIFLEKDEKEPIVIQTNIGTASRETFWGNSRETEWKGFFRARQYHLELSCLEYLLPPGMFGFRPSCSRDFCPCRVVRVCMCRLYIMPQCACRICSLAVFAGYL